MKRTRASPKYTFTSLRALSDDALYLLSIQRNQKNCYTNTALKAQRVRRERNERF